MSVRTDSTKRKRVSEELSVEVRDFEGCLARMRSTELQLSNFIASSSVKLNNTNQDKIRKLIGDIMDQAILQNNAIQFLLGRLIEQRDPVGAMTKKTDEVFTYADATKKVDP